jgi:hypothetical protein
MKFFPNHRAVGLYIVDDWQKSERLGKVSNLLSRKNFIKDLHRTTWVVDGVSFDDMADCYKCCEDNSKKQETEVEHLWFSKIFKNCKNGGISSQKQELYEKVIKLFFHQEFLFPNVNQICEKVGSASGQSMSLSNPKKAVHISLCETGLYISVKFFYYRAVRVYNNGLDDEWIQEINCEDGKFLVCGEANYKMEVSADSAGWTAKYGLLSSSIKCKGEYKAMLDDRSILQKIVDFLNSIMKNVTTDIHSLEFINSKQEIISQPIFFKSSADGLSVEKVIFPPTPEPNCAVKSELEEEQYQTARLPAR